MAARYHPDVIWGPFLLALALGLIVSAGLYFAYLWPQVEPADDDRAAAEPPGAADPDVAARAPADSEPASDAPAPASESTPA